jgi:UPF0716 protein FxsA
MKVFFLLFIVLPVTELMLLIKVGSTIGIMPTLGLILLTAVIGATLLRKQGLQTLLRANQRLQAGEIPADEMFQGFMLALAGAFLLTPGFVTDTLGFALLIPSVRTYFGRQLMQGVTKNGASGIYTSFGTSNHADSMKGGFYDPRYTNSAPSDGDIIDGEYEEIKDSASLERYPPQKK